VGAVVDVTMVTAVADEIVRSSGFLTVDSVTVASLSLLPCTDNKLGSSWSMKGFTIYSTYLYRCFELLVNEQVEAG
jgi:hypothetical protein